LEARGKTTLNQIDCTYYVRIDDFANISLPGIGTIGGQVKNPLWFNFGNHLVQWLEILQIYFMNLALRFDFVNPP
jgi:hypothetical protein